MDKQAWMFYFNYHTGAYKQDPNFHVTADVLAPTGAWPSTETKSFFTVPGWFLFTCGFPDVAI